MNYVRVGNSGLKITELTFGSALTIGTESCSETYAQEMIDTAWEAEIRAFDTANNYGMGQAEYLLGKSLQKYPRQSYILATKGSWPVGEGVYERGLSRKHILWAFDESMKRLGVDYVDIYYAHRPDPDAPMEEVARTFNSLIMSGKIRYWATSEWSREQLQELHQVCDALSLEKPVAEQFIYSYAIQKAEHNGVKDFCNSHGVGTLAFSPIAQGLLTGKYKNGVPADSRIAKGDKLGYNKTAAIYDQNRKAVDFFVSLCDKHGVHGNAAALQWCLRKAIYPVVGASKPKQIIENVRAIQEKIPQEFWRELEEHAD